MAAPPQLYADVVPPVSLWRCGSPPPADDGSSPKSYFTRRSEWYSPAWLSEWYRPAWLSAASPSPIQS
jgi:hypothetical protein